MFSHRSIILAVSYFSFSSFALPIRREVPQEHSHQEIINAVRASLNLYNPSNIQDPVFGLLGNAAAAAGAGNITDPNCLQQATADQAFTNALAAGDVAGQVNALLYRALERNSAKVGAVTTPCTSLNATNPEVAAIQQHQDPASPNAASINKSIVIILAQRIAIIGGDPQDALKSGTFAPGNVNDPTAKGNSCDDANDAVGCIFSQNLLVPDATADEIIAAVSGSNSTASTLSQAENSSASAQYIPTNSTSSLSSARGVYARAPASASSSSSSVAAAPTSSSVAGSIPAANGTAASSNSTPSSSNSSAGGSNLQTFSGAVRGIVAPPVTAGGRGFVVQGESSSFLNVAAALGRSCDVQHNACSNAANSGGGFSVSQCDTQDTQCKAAASA